MMQTVQVLGTVVAVLAATVAYKFYDTIYSCWRNSRLLRSYPGPSYGFFLGVIPQFAGKTPITRLATVTTQAPISILTLSWMTRLVHLTQGHEGLGR